VLGDLRANILKSMLTDVETLQRLAKFVPYVFIIFGFLLAISGQFVRSRIDDRIKTLEKQADINRKLTPPEVDADIALAHESVDSVQKTTNPATSHRTDDGEMCPRACREPRVTARRGAAGSRAEPKRACHHLSNQAS
jgi:hypothetical protein